MVVEDDKVLFHLDNTMKQIFKLCYKLGNYQNRKYFLLKEYQQAWRINNTKRFITGKLEIDNIRFIDYMNNMLKLNFDILFKKT